MLSYRDYIDAAEYAGEGDFENAGRSALEGAPATAAGGDIQAPRRPARRRSRRDRPEVGTDGAADSGRARNRIAAQTREKRLSALIERYI